MENKGNPSISCHWFHLPVTAWKLPLICVLTKGLPFPRCVLYPQKKQRETKSGYFCHTLMSYTLKLLSMLAPHKLLFKDYWSTDYANNAMESLAFSFWKYELIFAQSLIVTTFDHNQQIMKKKHCFKGETNIRKRKIIWIQFLMRSKRQKNAM